MIEFQLYENNTISEAALKKMNLFLEELETYKTGEQVLLKDIYQIDDSDPLFDRIIKFVHEYPEDVSFHIWDYFADYTEEAAGAVAFIPVFRKPYCIESSSRTMRYNGCTCCCCNTSKLNKYRFVNSRGFLKKNFDKYELAAIPDNGDGYVVTPKLYEALLSEGISKDYFFPVYSSKKDILGYELDGEYIIPSGKYVDGNLKIDGTCGKCGSTNYIQSEGQYHYVHKFISKDIVDQLEPVNYTQDTSYGLRTLIINKKLHDIIKKYCNHPYQFLPVFSCEESSIK